MPTYYYFLVKLGDVTVWNPVKQLDLIIFLCMPFISFQGQSLIVKRSQAMFVARFFFVVCRVHCSENWSQGTCSLAGSHINWQSYKLKDI